MDARIARLCLGSISLRGISAVRLTEVGEIASLARKTPLNLVGLGRSALAKSSVGVARPTLVCLARCPTVGQRETAAAAWPALDSEATGWSRYIFGGEKLFAPDRRIVFAAVPPTVAELAGASCGSYLAHAATLASSLPFVCLRDAEVARAFAASAGARLLEEGTELEPIAARAHSGEAAEALNVHVGARLAHIAHGGTSHEIVAVVSATDDDAAATSEDVARLSAAFAKAAAAPEGKEPHDLLLEQLADLDPLLDRCAIFHCSLRGGLFPLCDHDPPIAGF